MNELVIILAFCIILNSSRLRITLTFKSLYAPMKKNLCETINCIAHDRFFFLVSYRNWRSQVLIILIYMFLLSKNSQYS